VLQKLVEDKFIKLNHIYFENHSFKSSGSILLPADNSVLFDPHYSRFQNGGGLGVNSI